MQDELVNPDVLEPTAAELAEDAPQPEPEGDGCPMCDSRNLSYADHDDAVTCPFCGWKGYRENLVSR